MAAEQLTIDGFSPAELYVLGTAVGADGLFGLPDSRELGMIDDQIFLKAKQGLLEKKLLMNSGALTDQAVLLIELLDLYAQSPVYVRINQQMLAFRKETRKRDLIVLTEQQKGRSYRLDILPKSLFVTQLIGAHPLLQRRPDEAEKKFLLKKMTGAEQEAWASVRVDQTDLLALEWAPKEGFGFLRPYNHLLYVPVGAALYRTDLLNQQTRKASLYYLYKELFNWLDIPYTKEAFAE